MDWLPFVVLYGTALLVICVVGAVLAWVAYWLASATGLNPNVVFGGLVVLVAVAFVADGKD